MNSENEKSGLGSAVDALMEGQEPPAPNAEQLPLLPGAGESQEAIPTEGEGAPPGHRGPGRPPGARNKRTEEWTEYILSRHKSPLVFLAEQYTKSLKELVEELKCDPLDARKLQVQAARDLAPYVHQKQPVAMEIEGKGRVLLIASGLPGAPELSSDALTALGLAVGGDGGVLVDGEPVDAGDDEGAPS